MATLREAGVCVGIIVMVGIGGNRYAERHIRKTPAAGDGMRLGAGDVLYLSPLTEAETDAQLQALRPGLRFDPRGRPKVAVAVYDIQDFLY